MNGWYSSWYDLINHYAGVQPAPLSWLAAGKSQKKTFGGFLNPWWLVRKKTIYPRLCWLYTPCHPHIIHFFLFFQIKCNIHSYCFPLVNQQSVINQKNVVNSWFFLLHSPLFLVNSCWFTKNTGKSYEIPIFHGLSYKKKWKILLNPHFPWVKLTFLLGQNPRKIPPAAPQVLLLLSHARSNHLGILRQQWGQRTWKRHATGGNATGFVGGKHLRLHVYIYIYIDI